MNITPHILLGSGRLISFANQINNKFSDSIIDVLKKLPILNVDVVIYDNPVGTIPEIGIGGYTPSAHVVYISLDPNFPNFTNTITNQLKRTLSHELHHTARWINPGYGETLFEALITEGLADHFDLEVNGGSPEPWCIALNEFQISNLLKKAKSEFDDKNYDHNSWFFGSKEKEIPKWTGYSLGFKIVNDYLQKHPEQKASTLYNVKAEAFL